MNKPIRVRGAGRGSVSMTTVLARLDRIEKKVDQLVSLGQIRRPRPEPSLCTWGKDHRVGGAILRCVCLNCRREEIEVGWAHVCRFCWDYISKPGGIGRGDRVRHVVLGKEGRVVAVQVTYYEPDGRERVSFMKVQVDGNPGAPYAYLPSDLELIED